MRGLIPVLSAEEAKQTDLSSRRDSFSLHASIMLKWRNYGVRQQTEYAATDDLHADLHAVVAPEADIAYLSLTFLPYLVSA